MDNNMIGNMSGDVLGMLGDLCGKLKHGSITPVELDCFLNRRNPFEGRRKVLVRWETLYRDLGITADFSGLKIPAKRQGFDRLIAVPRGIKIQQVYDACVGAFKCWKWTNENLDAIVTENDRDPANGNYAIWVRERVEADEERKNKSANQLRERGVQGITLLEHLLYGLKFFKETGRHLDINNITLCTGSRYRGGAVPSVDFREFSGEAGVDWDRPGFASGILRSREVVS